MSGIRRHVLAIALAFSVVTAGGGATWAAPGAQSPLPPDEDLNNRGVDLRRAGEDRAALEVFKQAYDMTHSPRATAQLGLAYQALGRWELALPLVSKALETPGDAWVKKYLEQLRAALGIIREHVARIDLTGEPVGAEAIVNGSSAGRFPLPGPVTVAVGTVDIQVRAPGYRDEARKLNLAAHQVERVFVRLDKDPTAAAAGDGAGSAKEGVSDGHATESGADPRKGAMKGANDNPTSSDSLLSPRARRALKWTSLGLGVAGIGAGIVATVIHQKDLTDFAQRDEGRCRNWDGEGVDSETGGHRQDCQDALDGYTRARKWQIASFVAGGVFTAAWLVLQLTEPDDAGTTVGAVSCAPLLDRPGATCGLRF